MEIKTHKYKTYDDLLFDLSPQGNLYKIQNNYIFRGQAEDWNLIPSIFRKDNKSLLERYTFSMNLMENKEAAYRQAEYILLSKFYKNANDNGLKLPNTPFSGHNYLATIKMEDFIRITNIEWLPSSLAELAALAQHYGVMTRLLDWSFDINVALYFATVEAIKETVKTNFVDESKDIVIWLLDYANFECNVNKNLPLKFIIPNYSANPNICAQKGILTYWEVPKTQISKSLENKINSKPFDELIQGLSEKNISITETTIFKLVLPRRESLKIFKHLSTNHYNYARLFPSYYGAAQKIKEDEMVEKAERFFKNNRL